MNLLIIECMSAFAVPGTGIQMTFDSQVAPTGGGDRLLWIARRGAQARGVVIKVPQVLRWSLHPEATDAQLPVVSGQLARRSAAFRTALSNDNFFATADDFEFMLPIQPNDWDPEETLEDLA